MNLRTISFLSVILMFVALPIGCSTAYNASQREPYDVQQTATPFVQENDKGYTEFINETGWHVPLLPKAKKGLKEVVRKTSVGQKEVNVIVSTLLPLDNYRFTFGSMTYEQKAYLGESEMRLVALKELRVGKKIFSYVITAEKIGHDTPISANEPHGHPFLYKILDKDGDGKFETLFPGHSDNLVPKWAIE